MHGARLTGFALLIAALGGGCSRKRSEPASSQEARAGSAAREASAPSDAGAVDAAEVDAGPDAPPVPSDPFIARFPEWYVHSGTVPAAVQERIRAHLRGKTKAPIVLPNLIHVPRPGGGHEVFAIYEYSVYEDCVRRYKTAKEAREHCTDDRAPIHVALGLTPGSEGLINKECVTIGAVRARFAPPNRELVGDKPGAMTATSIVLPDTLCKVEKYHHLFVADVDNDKRLELYIDLLTVRMDSSGPRTGGIWEEQRDLFIWDGDPDTDVALRLGDSSVGWSTDHAAEHVELQDVDGNGHLDLIQLGASASDKTVHLYDKEDDRWYVADDPEPRPTAGSADTPSATRPAAGGAATPPVPESATPPAAGSEATPPALATQPTAGSAAKPAPAPALRPAAGSPAKP